MDAVLGGRYEIEKTIGSGGMGTVYRAVDMTLGRTVAIKVFQASDPEFERRIMTEARSMAHLSHPDIVSIYDVGVAEHHPYLVMEFVEGEHLARRLKSGEPLSQEQFLTILKRVAAALDYAHEQHIVHRDVKPENIMIRPNGSPKLMDFGIARMGQSRLTQTGTVIGTLMYMSPEQTKASEVDGRSDQYSLAIVAYEGLAGTNPFANDDVGVIIRKTLGGEMPSPRVFNPNLPEGIEPVLRKAMAVEPDDRYGTCTEFVSALAAALEGTVFAGALLPRRGGPVPEVTTEAAASTAVTGTQPIAPAPSKGVEPTHSITRLAAAAPTLFMESLPRTSFFKGSEVRFEKIEESFRFYRDNLQKQYDVLARQAQVVWWLWAGCVATGFLVLSGGLASMFVFSAEGRGVVTKATVTAAAGAMVYYIQRLFQQREDYYRRSAEEKNSHLEYGNKWLLAIQTVDAIEDPLERGHQQTHIARVLTGHLARPDRDAGAKKAGKGKGGTGKQK